MSAFIRNNIVIKESNTVLRDQVIYGSVYVEADNVSIINCTVNSDGDGIISSGKYFIARNNKINARGKAVSLVSGSYNSLVAQNETNGSIEITGGYNCSIVLNRAANLIARSNKNVYLIENELKESITVSDNNYVIADENEFSNLIASSNDNANGDTLHNVDSRLDVGANEELLPHTNRELFLGMERKEYVNAPEYAVAPSLNEYILSEAKKGGTIIIPPGAYVANETLLLQEIANVAIYAYGVYHESSDYRKSLRMLNCNDITIKGLTIGYSKVSASQMQIVDKLGDNKLLMIASAGFPEKVGKLAPDVYAGHSAFIHPGERIQWTSIGYWGNYNLVDNGKGEILNDDGTFTVELVNRDAETDYYSMLQKGDFLLSRVKGGGSDCTVSIGSCQNILIKDAVTYGYAGALGVVMGGTSKKVLFYRYHNLAHSGYEIDKETYDRYKALEEKHGVDLEVYIDGEGRYRGPDTRYGSIDATHIGGSSEGLNAVSSLFENACDDATNQRGYSSSLHKVIDNHDGTYSLQYKNYMAWVYYWGNRRVGDTTNPGFGVAHFLKGDKIFAYASNGRTLCDTTVLTDAEVVDPDFVMYEEDFDFKGEMRHMKWVCKLMQVKVKAKDVDLGAIEGYNTEISHYTMDDKVIVDNISRNSAFFKLDNCMVRDNMGRVLVKTREGIIKNCTIRNVPNSGIKLSAEPEWGESSVPCHITIERCLLDKTSTYYGRNSYISTAPISVEGLGKSDAKVTVKPGYIPSKNIRIENNVFRNIPHKFFITASAVDGLTIKNNVFESECDETESGDKRAIYINGCINVNISDNTYSGHLAKDVSRAIEAKNYNDLHGSDVDGIFPKDKLSCEEKE